MPQKVEEALIYITDKKNKSKIKLEKYIFEAIFMMERGRSIQ